MNQPFLIRQLVEYKGDFIAVGEDGLLYSVWKSRTLYPPMWSMEKVRWKDEA